MIDLGTLRKEIDEALNRFSGEAALVWAQVQRRHFLDLRMDPRPWGAPLRAANTNGSIFLDRYPCFLTPETVRFLGLEVALALILVGMVTEDSKLFSQPTPSPSPTQSKKKSRNQVPAGPNPRS